MPKPEIEIEKYRIDSTRLKDWDYSNPWWYYVTIITKDHKHWFGKIENGEMILNKYGKIADCEWLKISELREYVKLDYYVIMPNHIHGIIIINERESRDVARYVSTTLHHYIVEFQLILSNSLHPCINNQINRIVPTGLAYESGDWDSTTKGISLTCLSSYYLSVGIPLSAIYTLYPNGLSGASADFLKGMVLTHKNSSQFPSIYWSSNKW